MTMSNKNQQKDYHPICNVESPKLFETCPIEPNKGCKNYDYQLSLTFAREDRDIAEKVNTMLKEKGIRTFYDKDHQANLLGKRLTKEFEEIYGSKSRYVVPIISENYSNNIWANLEMDIIRRETQNRNNNYILPLRIDDTQILGIPDDIGYIDMIKEGFEKTIDLIIQRLNEDPCIDIHNR